MEKVITNSLYNNLLKQIRKEMTEGLVRAQNVYERERVITYWNIGKAISNHLLIHKNRADYGNRLFNRLSNDLELGERLLYQVTQFYNTYPDFEPSANIKWSHYRLLASIKNDKQRKILENKVSEDKLSKRNLEVLVKDKYSKGRRKETIRIKELRYIRGKLYTYKIIEVKHTESLCIDLGFRIYRETEEANIKGKFVESIKGEKDYSIKPASTKKKYLYTYKAYVSKIIDGDTMWLDIDLGFNTWIKHKARLRGVDTPPMETKAGQKAYKYVKSVLRGLPYVIIKSHGRDKYDRPLVDLFYMKDAEPERVLKEGIFLNQELLNKGMADILE